MALCTSLSLTAAWHSAKRFSSESFKPESTERSGEGAGTGHHRDGEETDPADMGRAGPIVACCW